MWQELGIGLGSAFAGAVAGSVGSLGVQRRHTADERLHDDSRDLSWEGMARSGCTAVTGVFDRADIDAVAGLARKAEAGTIRQEEKTELRLLLAKYSPRAHDLSGPDLLPVALFFLGVATLARGGLAAAASAS